MRISDWSSDVCSSDLIGYWFSVAWIFERQAGGFQLCGGLRRHMSCCEAGASAGSLCGSRRDRSAARDDGRGRFPADRNHQLYFCGAKPAVGDAWRRGSEPDRLNVWILPTSENFGRRIDVHPAAIGVRGLFHDESDGAGNIFRLKRRQELVPTGLAVRFHILEYLGTGCAGRNKSDLYPRTGHFDPERVREHLQREFQPARKSVV